jgi:hypothetical protein
MIFDLDGWGRFDFTAGRSPIQDCRGNQRVDRDDVEGDVVRTVGDVKYSRTPVGGSLLCRSIWTNEVAGYLPAPRRRQLDTVGSPRCGGRPGSRPARSIAD